MQAAFSGFVLAESTHQVIISINAGHDVHGEVFFSRRESDDGPIYGPARGIDIMVGIEPYDAASPKDGWFSGELERFDPTPSPAPTQCPGSHATSDRLARPAGASGSSRRTSWAELTELKDSHKRSTIRMRIRRITRVFRWSTHPDQATSGLIPLLDLPGSSPWNRSSG